MTAPVMTVRELRERVELGIEWLDAVVPGWVDRIDLTQLHLACPRNCVLGQTVGFPGGMDLDQAAQLGFEASASHDAIADEYEALTGLWKAAVDKRRSGP
ncbi:hypothetical protein ACH4T9_19880 [Micromonospora sp. NPDC020750]|uniref:hypothetical protein n=1 Tax=unclassified Micromonospora TaxID=2617518 RepID=UPI003799EBEE